jgi:riboflavin kinase/FMN adenylyltransferase
VILVNSVASFPIDMGSTVVTIGKFDGIHLGHQALLAETITIAEEHALVPVVVTFDRHPGSLLNPLSEPHPLIGPNQKHELLAESGMEAVLTLTFDEALAKLSAKEFVEQILVLGLSAKAVVVGADFKFGANQSGDIDSLRELGAELGFLVKVVESIELGGVRVSTTLIRDLLENGNVKEAAKLLGRLHATRGEVEHGLKIGREIGFPTANISRTAEGVLPKDGVYAGWLYDANGERYPAALSIGINETISEVPRLLEVHVLDRKDLDFYYQIVNVEYVDFIRPALKFAGVEELIASINADLLKIRVILG